MLNLYYRAGMPVPINRMQRMQKPKNVMSLHSLNNDCFVKRPYVGINLTAEEEIEKLYDETFNETMLDAAYANPVIKAADMPRPVLKITHDKTGLGGASYNFADNELTVSFSDKDLFLILSKNDKGEITNRILADSSNLDDEINSARSKYGVKMEVLKLSEAEKNFKLKAETAHELRHYMQHHLIASSNSLSSKQQEEYGRIFKNAEELQKNYIDACQKSGIEPDRELINMKIPDYWNRCKADILLEENASLKFSSNRKDKRRIALKDIMNGISDGLKYGRCSANCLNRASEIDASNYEYEYITKFAAVNNVRKEFADYLASKAAKNCRSGIANMKSNGIKFIEQ